MRYVLGASFNFAAVAPPAPPGAKADPALGFVGIEGTNVNVTLPAYDLATCNKLMEIRAYLASSGTALPVDAPSYIASALVFTTADVSTVQTGAAVSIPLPEVAPGAYVGQLVLGFDQ